MGGKLATWFTVGVTQKSMVMSLGSRGLTERHKGGGGGRRGEGSNIEHNVGKDQEKGDTSDGTRSFRGGPRAPGRLASGK